MTSGSLEESDVTTAQETSNKATFSRLQEATNTGDAELISKTIDEPDVLIRTPLPVEAIGAQALKEVFVRLHRAVGFLSFGVVAGIAIVRGATLPRSLGWISIAIGIRFVIPPIEFAGFLLFLIWVVVVSVLVTRRTPVARIRREALSGPSV